MTNAFDQKVPSDILERVCDTADCRDSEQQQLSDRIAFTKACQT
jgi:hypothetical protein